LLLLLMMITMSTSTTGGTEMASYKAIPHTALGKYNARKTLETEHRDGHLDSRGDTHQTAMCQLCVADAVAARANYAFYR
jgi:hypothetical protein